MIYFYIAYFGYVTKTYKKSRITHLIIIEKKYLKLHIGICCILKNLFKNCCLAIFKAFRMRAIFQANKNRHFKNS